MMTRDPVMALARRWWLVVWGAVLGAVMFGVQLAAGARAVDAALSFVIVLGYAVVVAVLQSRFETMRALAGRPIDERWQRIHEQALALTANVGIAVSLVGFLAAELTHRDAGPFALVAAVMGFSYLAGIVIFRSRT